MGIVAVIGNGVDLSPLCVGKIDKLTVRRACKLFHLSRIQANRVAGKNEVRTFITSRAQQVDIFLICHVVVGGDWALYNELSKDITDEWLKDHPALKDRILHEPFENGTDLSERLVHRIDTFAPTWLESVEQLIEGAETVWMSTRIAAAYLGVTDRTVRTMCQCGEIPGAIQRGGKSKKWIIMKRPFGLWLREKQGLQVQVVAQIPGKLGRSGK